MLNQLDEALPPTRFPTTNLIEPAGCANGSTPSYAFNSLRFFDTYVDAVVCFAADILPL